MFLVRWLVRCAKCDKEEALITLAASPGRDFIPSLPEDWREVFGRFYCPRHKVEMMASVDGDPVIPA